MQYGVVESDGIELSRLVEKPSFEFFVSAGISVLQPDAYAFVPKGEHFDMPELIERLLREKRRVISFPIREYWLDIGQHADYDKANADVQVGRINLGLD